MLIAIYIVILLVLTLCFVRGQDRCLLGYFVFIGLCLAFTPIVAIPVWKLWRG